MQEEDVAVKPLSNVQQQQHELASLQKKIAYENNPNFVSAFMDLVHDPVSQNGQTCSTLCKKKKKKKSSHRLLSSRRSLVANQREAFSLHSVSEQEDLVAKRCGMD
ncbi:unnamed protein product [Sphagnum compactum]